MNAAAPAGALDRLLLTLWAGITWAIGFVAVPILFARLPTRVQAGELAQFMFSVADGLGLVVLALLVLRTMLARGWRGWRVRLMLAAMAVIALLQFGLHPVILAYHQAGIHPGTAAAARFEWVHRAASLLYALDALAALILVLAGPPPVDRQA